MAHAAIDRRCTLAEDGEGEAEPRMGAAMALAMSMLIFLPHFLLSGTLLNLKARCALHGHRSCFCQNQQTSMFPRRSIIW